MAKKMKVVYLYVSMETSLKKKMQYKTPFFVDYALKPKLYIASDTWY
jgi:hypothetical protein